MVDEPESEPSFLWQEGDKPEEPKKRGRPKADAKADPPTPIVRPARDRIRVEGDDILSEEDRAALEKEAANIVSEDFRKEARQKYLKKAVEQERMKYAPEEQILPILIDLPGHADRITINRQEFHQGTTYNVPISLYRSLAEIVYRAWQHEAVVGGANRDQYIRPRNISLRPGMENFSHPNAGAIMPPNPQSLMRV